MTEAINDSDLDDFDRALLDAYRAHIFDEISSLLDPANPSDAKLLERMNPARHSAAEVSS